MSAHEASDGEVPECDPIGQLLAYFETVNWLQVGFRSNAHCRSRVEHN